MSDKNDKNDMSTETAITKKAKPERDEFFTPKRLDMRKKNEERYINKPYPYDRFEHIWPDHRRVAHWAFRGRTPETIAKLCGLDPMTVRRIINHPPVAEWIEVMRERLRDMKEKANEAKADVAEKAFEITRGIINGEEKPEKTRLDACKTAMAMDPHGRYELYNPVNDRSAPLGTDELRDFFANKAIIDAQCKVVEIEETKDERETSE